MNSIGLIGCGKLGICYATLFAKSNLKVYCYDINNKIIESINNDTYNYIEPNLNELIKTNKHNLIICNNIKEIIDKNSIIITFIQTPSLEDGSYNHSYIDKFIYECINIGKQENKKTIVISSTVMPEYSSDILEKIKEYNYDITYNPSFISQGSIIANIINPDIILIGNDNNNYKELIEIHKKVIENPNIKFKLMKLKEAEITKIAINCYITMKISYANLIGDFTKTLDCNPYIILDAIGDDCRIGNKYLKYGYGFGGPCLPRDNRALFYYFNKNNKNPNINMDLCNITDINNKNHLLFQYEELKNQKEPIEFKYITYKDTSDILEESQKLKLALLLSDNGNDIIIYERSEIINQLKDKYKKLKFININPAI
jgi:UDPglucose 6-dehydrogenase